MPAEDDVWQALSTAIFSRIERATYDGHVITLLDGGRTALPPDTPRDIIIVPGAPPKPFKSITSITVKGDKPE
jgi:hypothetical protein